VGCSHRVAVAVGMLPGCTGGVERLKAGARVHGVVWYTAENRAVEQTWLRVSQSRQTQGKGAVGVVQLVSEGGWRVLHECSLMPTYRCRSSAPASAWSRIKRLPPQGRGSSFDPVTGTTADITYDQYQIVRSKHSYVYETLLP
jgi:hypothetical protein